MNNNNIVDTAGTMVAESRLSKDNNKHDLNIMKNVSINKNNIFVPSVNIDQRLKQKRTNFLIGASTNVVANNSFQLPEVLHNTAAPLIATANTSMVGFNNNR